MNTLYLIRHGENTANLTREFSHRAVDYSLTPRGIKQAQQTAEYFRTRRLDAIYTSPLKRALETAQIIGAATGREPQVLEQFREVNVGRLEGQPPTHESWAEHDRIVRLWMTEQPELLFPEGENYHMLLARMRSGLAAALRGRANEHVLIVGHGGIFTFTLKDICHAIDLPWLIAQPSRNCSITEIEVTEAAGEWRGTLIAWASTAHLSGDALSRIIGHPAFDDHDQSEDRVSREGG
jgi:2,3-bisphosphoglycerate-dependent phosphoglycerate mutase